MFALLMTPSEAAPAPAPSPQLGLESLLLAKLLFLKGKNMIMFGRMRGPHLIFSMFVGYLVGQYLHGSSNARSGAAH